MKKIQLGFDSVSTLTIDDEEYVKAKDIPKIVEYAYGEYLGKVFNDAMRDVKFLCDTEKGIVTVINTQAVINTRREQ